MKLHAIAAASALILTAGGAGAQAAGEASAMPECTGPCTYSHQVIGDTVTPVDSSSSYSNQVNPSSSSNASGVDIGADQRLQQSGNTVDQSGNRLGDSRATGGAASATGNWADNTSSASTGASTSSVGNTSSSSGGNVLGNDSRNSNTAKGGAADQRQSQQQGINDAGNSQNTNTMGQANRGGDQANAQGQQSTNTVGQGQESTVVAGQSADVRTGAVSGVDSAGNSRVSDDSQTTLDASDNSTHRTEIDASVRYYPPVIPANPVQLAAGNLMVTGSGCGPIVNKTREEVVGTFHGLLGVNHVDLGWDEDIVDAVDPATGQLGYYARVTLRNGDVQLIGSQVTTTHALIGVGGGRNLSLFGAGSSGGAGQVGAGGNSSMQRVVLRHTVRACDAGTWKLELPVVEQVRQ